MVRLGNWLAERLYRLVSPILLGDIEDLVGFFQSRSLLGDTTLVGLSRPGNPADAHTPPGLATADKCWGGKQYPPSLKRL